LCFYHLLIAWNSYGQRFDDLREDGKPEHNPDRYQNPSGHKGQKNALVTSNVIKISIPNVTIEELTDPIILIDKTHYYLEIQDKGKIAKKYPSG